MAAYWIAILLAVPLWWRTTSIQRLPLPDARVYEQAGKSVSIPVRLCLEGSVESLSVRLQKALQVRVPEGLDVVVTSGKCESAEGTYIVSPGSTKVVQGRGLSMPMNNFDDLLRTILALVAPSDATRVAQFASRYRLAFSLLNEDASSGNNVMSWDIRKGIQEHIQPLLDALKSLHNFTIESQVQYYAPLEFDLTSSDGLSHEDLTVFVNSAEWSLSSSASNDPVLHFVLFVPSASHIPLKIAGSNSLAFLLPQWGGILLYNPPKIAAHPSLTESGLHRSFSTFSTQLVGLLGIPELPSDVTRSQEDVGVISEWQLDALTRRRMLETAKGAQDTLRSFIKLANQIDNMPVGEDVRDDIVGSLNALEKVYNSASSSLSRSFAHSAEAFNLASRAFFNPGVLALLYFPTEHTYAVYAPLFASAVIPLFVAVLREVLAWKRQRRS